MRTKKRRDNAPYLPFVQQGRGCLFGDVTDGRRTEGEKVSVKAEPEKWRIGDEGTDAGRQRSAARQQT